MKLRWIGFGIAVILFILVISVIVLTSLATEPSPPTPYQLYPPPCPECTGHWVYAFDINEDTSLENFIILAKQYDGDPNLIFSKSVTENTDEGKIILVPRYFGISSYQHALDETSCTDPSVPCFLTCSPSGPGGMACGEPDRSKINSWFPQPEDFFKVENGKIFKKTKFICREAGSSQEFDCTSKEWTEIKWDDSSIELVKFKIDKQGKVFVFSPAVFLI